VYVGTRLSRSRHRRHHRRRASGPRPVCRQLDRSKSTMPIFLWPPRLLPRPRVAAAHHPCAAVAGERSPQPRVDSYPAGAGAGAGAEAGAEVGADAGGEGSFSELVSWVAARPQYHTPARSHCSRRRR
jgi:hypothetical protein